MKPEVPVGDVCGFLWEHLVNDVRNVYISLERSEDEVLLMIHLVLSEIMSRSTMSKSVSVITITTATLISVMSSDTSLTFSEQRNCVCFVYDKARTYVSNFFYLQGELDCNEKWSTKTGRKEWENEFVNVFARHVFTVRVFGHVGS